MNSSRRRRHGICMATRRSRRRNKQRRNVKRETSSRKGTIMFTRREFMAGAGAVLASSAFTQSASAASSLDLATVWPDGNFRPTNAKRFADEVGKATGGEVKITVQAARALR